MKLVIGLNLAKLEFMKTILLIEPDTSRAREWQTAVESWGYQCRPVATATEALSLLIESSPTIDLALVATSQALPLLDSLDKPRVFYSAKPDDATRLTLAATFSVEAKQASLRRTEGMFSQVFHLSPDPITISRLDDGVLIAANESFYRVLGFAPEAAIGISTVAPEMPIWNNPADRETFVKLLRQDGQVNNFVAHFRHLQGHIITGIVSAKILTFDGAPCLLSITRDISELSQVRELLVTSNLRFESLFNNSADAIFLVEPNGTIVKVNQTACTRLQYSATELEGMNVRDINAPEVRGAEDPNLKKVLADGSLLAVNVHLARDGRTIPTEINVRLIELDGGKLFLTVARDISDRYAQEQELATSRERYQLIFENSGTSNAIFDLYCRLVLLNSLSRRELGNPEPVGKSVEELFGPHQGSVIRQRMITVQHSRQPVTHESTFDLPSGRKTYQSTYQPLLDSRGALVGIQIISRDVTEARQLDERLRLTDRMEAISVLAGGIAHDFNNLLAGLSGNLDLARLQLETHNVSGALARIDKATQVFQRAKALTRQLLTFSKGGAPHQELCLLGPLLKEWGEFAFSGSDVSLQLDIAPDLWLVECDAMQIGQALDNLLINARQASVQGGVVHLRAENLQQEPPLVALRVIDQGPGISDEMKARIFDPFFTTKASGSGLGLASALSIVKQHGGWIDVDSWPAKGSRFSILLPALPGRTHQKQIKAADSFVGSDWALVMDDEEILRDAVGEMLVTMGFSVLRAKDGDEAVEQVRAALAAGKDLRLVLLDLTIPGGHDGLHTATALQRLGTDACFVAMSGYSAESSPGQLDEGGFAGRLSKPFSHRELVSLLQSLKRSPWNKL